MDAFSCTVGDFKTMFCREKISYAVVHSVANQLVLYRYFNHNIYNAMTRSTSDLFHVVQGAYPRKRSRGSWGLAKLAPASCRASRHQRRCLLGGSGGMLPRKFLKKKVHFPANLGISWGIFWIKKRGQLYIIFFTKFTNLDYMCNYFLCSARTQPESQLDSFNTELNTS